MLSFTHSHIVSLSPFINVPAVQYPPVETSNFTPPFPIFQWPWCTFQPLDGTRAAFLHCGYRCDRQMSGQVTYSQYSGANRTIHTSTVRAAAISTARRQANYHTGTYIQSQELIYIDLNVIAINVDVSSVPYLRNQPVTLYITHKLGSQGTGRWVERSRGVNYSPRGQ